MQLNRLKHLSGNLPAKQKTSLSSQSVELCEEAKNLSEHIRIATDSRKLNNQIPYFVCPAWAHIPPTTYHLFCTRNGAPFPALDLSRFPYYLFGRNPVVDFVLDHPSVSGIHAALVYHPHQSCFVVVDLHSTNGVKVNDQVLEKEKPFPVRVGDRLRFGYSSREYELRQGKPPSSKRLRELEEEEARPLHCLERSEAVAAPPPPETAPETTAAAEAAPEEVFHLYQLVLKHKNVKKPVSGGARKGECITRSLQDAIEMAHWIVSSHQREHPDHPEKWSVEEFVAAIKEYHELKGNGDLGIVARTTFTHEEFANAAFSLQRHEVSAPVTSVLGVHLIYRCD